MTTPDISRVYDKLDKMSENTNAKLDEITKSISAIERDLAVVRTKMEEIERDTIKNTKEIFGNGTPGLKSKVYRLMMIVAVGGSLLAAAVGGISVATMTRLVAPASITGPAE